MVREARSDKPLGHDAPALGARFDWIRHLGRGGHGRVELVFDRVRGERVALKLLESGPAASIALKQEFRWLRDVVHPHLVAMIELVIEPELECLVLEYVDGVSLLHHLGCEFDIAAATATQPIGTAAALADSGAPHACPAGSEELSDAFLQLADALEFLEGRRLVHGDLKPENILVEQGRVVVLDFGIARVEGGSDSRPVGTLAYMAPEQLAGEEATSAADRYALGVLLFRVLAGRLPFVGTAYQVRAAKRGAPPRLGGSVLDELASALLSPDPAERPTLATIRAALTSRGGSPVLALPSATSLRTTDPLGEARARERAPAKKALVGRASELARLSRSVDRREVAVVVGEAGLGKTALLDALSAEHGKHVVRSRCYANESIRWNAVDGLVDALLTDEVATRAREGRGDSSAPDLSADHDALASLFPALGATADVLRMSAAVSPRAGVVDLQFGELVRRAARGLVTLVTGSGRSVLVVDDLQWADADSMMLLVEVLREHSQVGVVLATRGPDDRSEQLVSALVGTGRAVETIELSPLTEHEVGALARSFDVPPGALDEAVVHAATGGVPFLVEELAWATRKHEHASRHPVDAGTFLSARIAELDPATQTLLAVMAVNEAPLEREALAVAARQEIAPRTVQWLASERLCRIEREGGGKTERLDLYHDVIRRELLLAMSPDTRRSIHASLAESTLSQRPERNADIARHLFGAGDPRAKHFARAAADDARAVFAFDRAAAWLRRALELEVEQVEALALRRMIADCLRLAEHHAEAARELEALAGAQDGTAAIHTRRLAAEQWLCAGDLERGLRFARELDAHEDLAELGASRHPLLRLAWERFRLRSIRTRRLCEPSRWVAPARAASPEKLVRIDLAWTVAGCFALIDPVRSSALHASTLRRALEAGDADRVLRSLAGEGMYSGLFGASTRKRSDRILAAVEQLAERLDTHARGIAVSARSIVEIQRGGYGVGASLSLAGLELIVNHPKTIGWELTTNRHFLLHALYYLGRFDELRRHVETEYRESKARSNRHRMSDVSLHHATVAWLLSHGPAVARERADAASAFWSPIGPNIQLFYGLVSDITVDLWSGDSDSAWEALRRRGLRTIDAPLVLAEGLRTDALHIVARAAIAHVAKRRSVLAANLAFAATALLAAESSPHAAPLARLQLAGLAAAFGARDLAVGLARGAATRLREAGLLGYALAAESFTTKPRTPAETATDAGLARVLAPGLYR